MAAADTGSGNTLIIVLVVVGVVVVAGGAAAAVFKLRKQRADGGDGEIDPETGVKTPKDKGRLSLAMLMNHTTNGLKNNTAESFAKDEEGVKTQMTKEEILKAEKEKIEKLKVQLKENGMDPAEIENQIK